MNMNSFLDELRSFTEKGGSLLKRVERLETVLMPVLAAVAPSVAAEVEAGTAAVDVIAKAAEAITGPAKGAAAPKAA